MPTPDPTPPFEDSSLPRPGHFVKAVLPQFQETQVHHALYLPANYNPNQKSPLIVEFPGNLNPPCCTGKVQDCKLGYHASAGQDFLWLVLPFINSQSQSNQLNGFGDIEATVQYTLDAVRQTCTQFNADPGNIFITGFSRGAIATGYIGLHDDTIAKLWKAFFPYAHFDGGKYTAQGAKERLARIQFRPVLLLYGENDISAKPSSLAGGKILSDLGHPPTLLEIPNTAHVDTWIQSDSKERQQLRTWLTQTVNSPCANLTLPRV